MKSWLKFWQDYRNVEIRSEEDLLFQVGKTISGKTIETFEFNILIQEISHNLELKESDNILDLCSGNGIITYELSKFTNSIYGVDFSKIFVTNARKFKSNSNIKYFNQDVLELHKISKKLSAFKINKILIYDALAYFDNTELFELIEIINNIATNKYIILLGSVLDKDKKWRFYNTLNRKINYFFFHRLRGKNKGLGKWWNRNEIENICKEFNLEVTFLNQNPQLYTSHYRTDIKLRKNNTHVR